jgi:hypothetical protein
VANALAPLGLIDVFRTVNPSAQRPTHFTARSTSWSRLDYFFTSPVLVGGAAMSPSDDVTVVPIADHLAIRCHISFPEFARRGPGRWRLRPDVLDDKAFIRGVRALAADTLALVICGQDPCPTWDQFKSSIRHLAKRVAKHSRSSNAARVSRLRAALNDLLASPEESRDDAWATDTIQAYTDLHSMLTTQAAKGTVSRTADALLNHDRSSHLLRRLRRPLATGAVLSVFDGDGEVFGRARLLQAHHRFYTDMYTSGEADETAADALLRDFPTQLSPTQSADLDEPFSADEVAEAIRGAPGWRAPGPDGLPGAFYKRFAPELAPLLLFVFRAAQERGVIPPSFTESITVLIYKKGDRRDLGNWRPISLLGNDAKLLTAIMTARLNVVLPSLIHPDQAGFVPGRHIHEHIFFVDAAIEACRTTSTPGILAFFDQAKAYDRVEWQWLRKVSVHLGFGQRWQALLGALYSSCSSRLLVNNFLTAPVLIRRGLRQGDPLSPALYNLTFEPLLHMLRSSLPPVIVPRPAGGVVALPSLRVYADDTAALLPDQDALCTFVQVYSMYSRASGAALNAAKTEYLLLGGADPPDLHGKVGSDSAPIRYLGVLFGPSGIAAEASLARARGSVLLRIADWSAKVMSPRGRALALNALILSKLWYIAQVMYIPRSFVAGMERICRTFVRAGRTGNVALAKISRPTCEGGLGLLPIAIQLRACGGTWWRFTLLAKSPPPWVDLIRDRATTLFASPGCNFAWLADASRLRGRFAHLPPTWRARLDAFRGLASLPPLRDIPDDQMWAAPAYLALVDFADVYVFPTRAWIAADVLAIRDVLVPSETGLAVRVPTPDDPPGRRRLLLRIAAQVASGVWRIDADVSRRLSNAAPPTPSPTTSLLLSVRMGDATPSDYRVRDGRRWLLRNNTPLHSTLLPTADPTPLWRRVFDKQLPVKYQVALWRCHHNSMYTRQILHHYHPDVDSPFCPFCPEVRDTVDHRFRSCASLATPFWRFVLGVLGHAEPPDRDWFWQSLPPRPNMLSSATCLLAHAAAIWTLYRGFAGALFGGTAPTPLSLRVSWLAECDSLLLGMTRKARRHDALDAHHQKWNPFLHALQAARATAL